MADEQRGTRVEEMRKRREIMEDGRRYIIYYTFGTADDIQKSDEREEEQQDRV